MSNEAAASTPSPTVTTKIPASPSGGESAERLKQADAIIHRNVLWALGAGVVPLPVLDIAAVSAVELKLLKELSDIYSVEFSKKIAKKIIFSLLTSAGVLGIGCLIGGSLSKLVPFIGTTVGFVSVPVIVAAFTHGLGRVFLMHFEAGGTLLDFDAVAMRQYFKKEFEKGKEVAAAMKQQGDRAKAETKTA